MEFGDEEDGCPAGESEPDIVENDAYEADAFDADIVEDTSVPEDAIESDLLADGTIADAGLANGSSTPGPPAESGCGCTIETGKPTPFWGILAAFGLLALTAGRSRFARPRTPKRL